MPAGRDPLGGHIVQGHVDGTGAVVDAATVDGGTWRVRIPGALVRYCVVKGSIALDGVSLTIAAMRGDVIEVAVIPHTAEVTTLGRLPAGRAVNVEVDVLAKHVERLLEAFASDATAVEPPGSEREPVADREVEVLARPAEVDAEQGAALEAHAEADAVALVHLAGEQFVELLVDRADLVEQRQSQPLDPDRAVDRKAARHRPEAYSAPACQACSPVKRPGTKPRRVLDPPSEGRE